MHSFSDQPWNPNGKTDDDDEDEGEDYDDDDDCWKVIQYLQFLQEAFMFMLNYVLYSFVLCVHHKNLIEKVNWFVLKVYHNFSINNKLKVSILTFWVLWNSNYSLRL